MPLDRNKIDREVNEYSSKANRAPWLIIPIRKILWKLIRVFHYYEIEKTIEMVEDKLNSKQNFTADFQKTNEENAKMLKTIADLESKYKKLSLEFTPLVNRVIQLEKENSSNSR